MSTDATQSVTQESALARDEFVGMRMFMIVWVGQFVSLLGSSMTGFAFAMWMYRTGNYVSLVSTIALCASLPFILVSPFAGPLVDRWDRRGIMIGGDALAAVTTLVIFTLIYTGQWQFWQIYVLVAISSVAAAFQAPAFDASVPLLVPKCHLGRVSGLNEMSGGVVMFLSPMLAGVLIDTIGITGILLIDLATFLVAVTTLCLVRIPRPLESEEGSQGKGRIFREMATGIRYLRNRPGLLGLLWIFAFVSFLLPFVSLLFIPLVLSMTTPMVLSAIISAGGVGALIGGAVVLVYGAPEKKVNTVLGIIFLGGLLIAVLGFQESAVLIGTTVFVMMLITPFAISATQVLWLTKVAPDVQGRVFALTGMILECSGPLAFLLVGPFADGIFEPLMAEGGPLAESVGTIIGVGKGRGMALMFIIVGTLTSCLAIVAILNPRIRFVETEVPDVIADLDEKDEQWPEAIDETTPDCAI